MSTEKKKAPAKENDLIVLLRFLMELNRDKQQVELPSLDEETGARVRSELKLMGERVKLLMETLNSSLRLVWKTSDQLFLLTKKLEQTDARIFSKADEVFKEQDSQLGRVKKLKNACLRDANLAVHQLAIEQLEDEYKKMHNHLSEIIAHLKVHDQAQQEMQSALSHLNGMDQQLRRLAGEFKLKLERGPTQALPEDKEDTQIALVKNLLAEYGL